MKDIDQQLGNLLRSARTTKGVSQRQLAKLIGVSQDVISDWEQGKRALKVSDLYSISDALDVSLSHFLVLDKNDQDRSKSLAGCLGYLMVMPTPLVYASETFLEGILQTNNKFLRKLKSDGSINIQLATTFFEVPETEDEFYTISGDITIRKG